MNAHADVFLSAETWRQVMGTRVPAQWPERLRGVTADSRQVRPGVIFHAIQGTHADGHAYLEDAVRRGAAGLVLERDPGHALKVPFVVVADAREVLARMAAAFFGAPAEGLRLTGVTGTNGKTTVAVFVRQLSERLGESCGMLGTVAHMFGTREIPARHTTPGAPELHQLLRAMVDADCVSCVMEVSSHALDQKRVAGLPFETVVFTNLSQDHLDYHGDMESYFAAKSRLFAFPEVRTRIVGEDVWSTRLAAAYGDRVLRCGLGAACEVRVAALQTGLDGSSGQLISPWGCGDFRINVPGAHNVRNALQAVAVLAARGHALSKILALLPGLTAAPGRLEFIPARTGKVVVDYAHTPDALANVMQTLRPLTRGKLLVVFGCGGDRDRTKRAPMAAAAAKDGDVLILTQDNPRTENPNQIFKDMLEGVPGKTKCEVEPDRAAAIRRGIQLLGPEDVLLIAGKGHESVQEFANAKVPFDDRQVARRYLEVIESALVGGGC